MGLFFPFPTTNNNMPLAKDLLHPRPEEEKRKHKLKRLVQHPNSYFMDVKCPGCYHHRFQSCSDRCLMCRLFHCPLSTNWRQGEAYRRMLFQKEATLNFSLLLYWYVGTNTNMRKNTW